MQTAAKHKLNEAELRRLALRVYDGEKDKERQAAVAAAERRHAAEMRRARFQVVFSIFTVFLLCMGYMYLNTQVTVVGYEINKQMAANVDLENENTRLVLQIEQATSPEKVAGYAAEHFNMVTATDDSVIYYDTAAMASADAMPTVRTGMAVDAKSIGSGSVEVLEDEGTEGFLATLGSLWEQLAGGDRIMLGMQD